MDNLPCKHTGLIFSLYNIKMETMLWSPYGIGDNIFLKQFSDLQQVINI